MGELLAKTRPQPHFDESRRLEQLRAHFALGESLETEAGTWQIVNAEEGGQ